MARHISAVLKGDKNILLAYLFGSAVKGGPHPKDIDIAVMLKKTLHGMKKLEFINRTSSKIEKAANRPADVIILNGAAPALRQQVVKYGHLLLERKRGLARKMTVDTITAYLDYLDILNFFHAKTARRKN